MVESRISHREFPEALLEVWHETNPAGGTVEEVIEAPLAAQDAILLERVALRVAAGTHSFFRAIKPDWRLEVIRHDPPRSFDADDAVVDSAFALAVIRLERGGRSARSRRELLLAGMSAGLTALGLAADERRALHFDGFRWAIELGRWDAVAREGLERRFSALRGGLDELSAGAAAGEPDSWGGEEIAALAMARWHHPCHGNETAREPVADARRRIAHNANRLAVFAEPEAILHYFMYRLLGGAPA